MRDDVDRMSETVTALEDDLSDHQKCLIRIETLIEVSQNRSRHCLPGPSD
jgi:hypothetical protein